MIYQLPDKVAIYAAALQSDINAERFQVVESGRLETYWIGTVYGGGVIRDQLAPADTRACVKFVR